MLTISALASRAGLRLTGEVDLTNHDQLGRALAALVGDGIAEIHLELAGVWFIDVAGARELMALTQSHPGLCLILHDPPESLQRLIALLWPGANPEIRFIGTHGWRDRGDLTGQTDKRAARLSHAVGTSVDVPPPPDE